MEMEMETMARAAAVPVCCSGFCRPAALSVSEMLDWRREWKLFAVDTNVVLLFYDWMRSPMGRRLVHGIDALYEHYNISRMASSFLDELRVFFQARLSVPELKYAIWNAVASLVLGLKEADGFIHLALAVSCFEEMVDDKHFDRENFTLYPYHKGPHIFSIVMLFENLCYNVPQQDYQETLSQYETDCLVAEVDYLGLVSDDTISRFDFGPAISLFDVTGQLCQLFYTWMSIRCKQQLPFDALFLKRVEDMIVYHNQQDFEAQWKKELCLLAEAATKILDVPGMQFLQLTLCFLVNATNFSLMTSEDLGILRSRLRAVHEVHWKPDVDSASEINLKDVIHKLLKDVENEVNTLACLPSDEKKLASWLLHDSMLHRMRRRQTDSCIYQLDCANEQIFRLLYTWMNSEQGKHDHSKLIRNLGARYRDEGWGPCRDSFVDEVVFTLYGGNIRGSKESRCEVWKRGAAGVFGDHFATSFVNLVAAVCRQQRSGVQCTQLELQEIKGRSLKGQYQVSKPLISGKHLIGFRRSKNLSEMILYLVQEIYGSYKLSVQSRLLNEIDGCNDPDDSGDDLLERLFCLEVPELEVPAQALLGVEKRLGTSNICLVKDVTTEVCRLFHTWLHLPGTLVNSNAISGDKESQLARSTIEVMQNAIADGRGCAGVEGVAKFLNVSEVAFMKMVEAYVLHGCGGYKCTTRTELGLCKEAARDVGALSEKISAGGIVLGPLFQKLVKDVENGSRKGKLVHV